MGYSPRGRERVGHYLVTKTKPNGIIRLVLLLWRILSGTAPQVLGLVQAMTTYDV